MFKSEPEPLDAENSSLLIGSIITAVVGTSSIKEQRESAKWGYPLIKFTSPSIAFNTHVIFELFISEPVCEPKKLSSG